MRQGHPITFQDQYRVDFLTDRAVRFLKKPQEKPFLLFVSQLEPHYQNDVDRPVAPHGYAERYQNPYIPPDLRKFARRMAIAIARLLWMRRKH